MWQTKVGFRAMDILREKIIYFYEREYKLHKSNVGTELTVEANLYLWERCSEEHILSYEIYLNLRREEIEFFSNQIENINKAIEIISEEN